MNTVTNVGHRVAGASRDVALIVPGEGASEAIYSYLDLEAQANAWETAFVALGLRPGTAVGVLSDNCAAFVFLWLGALRAGLIVVPINHKLTIASIAHIVRDASVARVFCDQARRALVPMDVGCTTLDGPLPVVAPRAPASPIDANAVAVVLYTSGSTGMPKGVPMTHGGYAWTIDSRLRGGPYAHHRLLVAAPLYHINALGAITFALAAGASAVLLPRFTASGYIDAIDRFGCTWLTSVPAMLAMVARETALLSAADLGTVQSVRMGSSPASAKLLMQVREIFPRATLSNAYGTTEGGPLVFGADPNGEGLPDGAAGWPLPDVEVRLVDRDGRPATTEGFLVMRSPATMRCYLNLPDKTRDVLSADGWYHTGDIFRKDEAGAYWFVSRADDMFVSGGENIHPQEVERILEGHPGVLQACVVPVADDIKGAKPVAFVVRRPGHPTSEADLKSHTLANGPAYQHPRRVFFLDALPLAGTNKVDRRRLMQQAATALQA